ncbi:MAG: cupin domain-containing protein [Mycobacterium sp.]
MSARPTAQTDNRAGNVEKKSPFLRPRRTAAWATALLLVSPGVAAAELGATTTINGSTPPGVMERLADITVLLDSVKDSQRVLVEQGIRKPGTRAPIHVNAFGGYSCVMTGTITVFTEGSAPTPYPAGNCYYKTPDVPMTAANLGADDVELVNTVELPAGASAVIVLEPGWPDLTDPAG